jgi:hypothetical protein
MDVTEQALYKGIAQALPGNRVVDISRAVQEYVESNGFSVVREFVGHGVGRTVHEEPQVPNYVEKNRQSPKLRPGMTMAIEPMVNAGTPQVMVLNDGWTVVTKDGQLSAHFEHTVLITEGGTGDFNMARKDAIEAEGRIVEILAATLFRVELANGHRLLAHVSGRRRLAFERMAWGTRSRSKCRLTTCPRAALWRRANEFMKVTSISEETLRKLQSRQTQGRVRVICTNPRHKQKQG